MAYVANPEDETDYKKALEARDLVDLLIREAELYLNS